MSVKIDSSKCTGCGACVTACPEQAITIHDDLAVINANLCIQCGTCAEVCLAGAIREVVPVRAELAKGGERMPFRRGWFGRGGWGRGNPYPFCRFYPWLPRRWWATPCAGFGYPHVGAGAGYPASVAPYYSGYGWRRGF